MLRPAYLAARPHDLVPDVHALIQVGIDQGGAIHRHPDHSGAGHGRFEDPSSALALPVHLQHTADEHGVDDVDLDVECPGQVIHVQLVVGGERRLELRYGQQNSFSGDVERQHVGDVGHRRRARHDQVVVKLDAAAGDFFGPAFLHLEGDGIADTGRRDRLGQLVVKGITRVVDAFPHQLDQGVVHERGVGRGGEVEGGAGNLVQVQQTAWSIGGYQGWQVDGGADYLRLGIE